MTQVPEIESEMPKAYDPAGSEARWFKFWLDGNYFRAERDPDKQPFTVIMPLPNVTGDLHMGHVHFLTPEDVMTRWHRMKGDSALWLPGIDHSGIGAQVVIERQLAAEGLTRHDLGRDKFVERMYRWADECRQKITEQEQRVGSSCDWSREKFTLDEGPSLAVRTAFVRLYEKGLLYKGERIVNWCPRCTTSLSDLEVEHQDITGELWYVRYPLTDGSGEYITVATTRPETILGDTAVAVNPKDDRFKHLIGKRVMLPAVNREIPIVADEAVDIDFGTGAVKVTPAHDPVDFEVAQRQGLPLINILNDDATMNENAGPYQGMDRFACREALITDLEKSGQLVKTEPYSHSVGHCDRCQTIIEPIASEQWFIDMKPLAKPALDAVRDGRVKIVPPRFVKVYRHWMENIRDWCISRQLWWGHRIPAWYCDDCREVTVAVDEPTTCRHCDSGNIRQDPDVLDTWFSSALWTHSTLGWPEDTEDMRYFYPTSVMETGYDIIFLWVARMIMMGLEDVGEVPFHTVYLHGLLRDANGEKMSKVRGNGIDPIEMVDEYGADALRFAVMTGSSPGNDVRLSMEKIELGRNFANKLWNATRFVVRSLDADGDNTTIADHINLPTEDRWILSRLSHAVAGATGLLDDFQLGEALRHVHDFLWGDFCDWYIELAKIRLRAGDPAVPSPVPVLVHALETSLRLLHPYMPFVTEELWQQLRQRLAPGWQPTQSITVAAFPEADESAVDDDAERLIESVVDVIRSIRNVRTQHKVDASRWIEARIYGGELTPSLAGYSSAIETLARARPVTFHAGPRATGGDDNVLVQVLKETEVVIPMESMVDLDAERKRLAGEIAQAHTEIARLETRLADKAFLGKAPAAVIERERGRLAERQDRSTRLKQELDRLG